MSSLIFTTLKSISKIPEPKRISILAYPWSEILDITGPYEVFAFASLALQKAEVIKEPTYLIEMLAEQPGPVKTLSGLEIVAHRSYRDVNDGIDTLIIPGGFTHGDEIPAQTFASILENEDLLEWINHMAPKVRRLVSVCSGAFLLAHCGLLEHRRATTHWDFCARFQEKYRSVKLEPDKIFIRDGNIYTSGGITSGIDLALALIEEDWGRELALFVAKYMVMFLKRPGGQSQFSTYLTFESSKRPDLRELQAWIIANPSENHTVESLADRMAMSPRNFARTFLAETGTTPAKFVELARLDVARQFLESKELSIEVVAMKSGFTDPERMRRCFIKHLGIPPKDYRERFGFAGQRKFEQFHLSPPLKNASNLPSSYRDD
ncbi:MAG: GlxA family transcriptional regulator [Gammaproteobacteria bacterium]